MAPIKPGRKSDSPSQRLLRSTPQSSPMSSPGSHSTGSRSRTASPMNKFFEEPSLSDSNLNISDGAQDNRAPKDKATKTKSTKGSKEVRPCGKSSAGKCWNIPCSVPKCKQTWHNVCAGLNADFYLKTHGGAPLRDLKEYITCTIVIN